MRPSEEYMKRAKDFCRLKGLANGEYPVVSREEHPKQWEEWRRYFRANRMPYFSELMGDGRREWTVPALWPHEFDAVWNAPSLYREAAE